MVLTILSLVIGYLTLSISVTLLFTAWSVGVGQEVTVQFWGFSTVCGLGFATLSGWLTALVAQRAPIFHAGLLSALLSAVCMISTFTGPAVASPVGESLFTAILNLAVGVTGVMTGGWLRFRQMKAQDAANKV